MTLQKSTLVSCHVASDLVGTTGVIKGFGSIPGVPKLVNVAHDGGGGSNHTPEELEKVKDGFTPSREEREKHGN